MTSSNSDDELRAAYLDLLKMVLTRSGFAEPLRLLDGQAAGVRGTASRAVRRALGPLGLELVRRGDRAWRLDGRDRPADAETMVGVRRLDNVQNCLEEVLAADVPGDVIETGVWRGGCAIFMRAVLKAHGDTARRVWVADSFEGLPKPDETAYPADAGDTHSEATNLAISLEEVRANFAKYGLLDDQVRFLPGWFEDTLPTAPITGLSLLRLDGDMYGSTIVALRSLYPRLSDGGFVIVDDFGAIPACRAAVMDYRRELGIEEPIQEIDWTGVFWRKPLSGAAAQATSGPS